MTKEEKAKRIVNAITSYAPWGDWNGVTREVIEKYVADGAAEYAKQQSIAFSKWKWDNRWFTFENGFWYYTFEMGTSMSNDAYNKNYRKTDEQLYELFIKSQEP